MEKIKKNFGFGFMRLPMKDGEIDTEETKRIVQEKTGVVEKCRFCWDGEKPGNPPACVGTCISGARIFGDLDDPDSDISKKLASGSGEVLNSDLGLSPSLYYFDLSAAEAMPVVSAVHRGGNVYKPFEG